MDILFFITAILTLLTTVSCQQQYFRTRPQPHVEVIQGSTFTLECAVGNQAGSVQWSKNGFLLGKWSIVFGVCTRLLCTVLKQSHIAITFFPTLLKNIFVTIAIVDH